MRFRLVYEGDLFSSQRDAIGGQRDKRALHKHNIRRTLHPQLMELWNSHDFLSSYESDPRIFRQLISEERRPALAAFPNQYQPLRELVAETHKHAGYRFVPLAIESWKVKCELDILFLRHGGPGSAIQSGDIDNRIKTLIDALRMPKEAEIPDGSAPGADEDPFYCLLDDDKLVTSFSVHTDQLLRTTSSEKHEVHIVITVNITPYIATTFNVGFG